MSVSETAPTNPADERLSLHGLAMAAYAAAHDIEPHQVDTTGGGFQDVADVLRRYIEAGSSDLAVALGLPADTDDPEITEVLEGLRAEIERAEDESAQLRRQVIDERVQATQTTQELFAKWRGERDQARAERDSERESRIAWALEADRLDQEQVALVKAVLGLTDQRAALSSLLRGMARRATKLRRGMRGHEARIAHLVSRPSVSDQTPATPDAEPATVSLCGVPHRISCNLVTEADEQWCTCDGPQRVGEALLDRLNGLSSVQGDTTPEAACVHGQTPDLTGLAARENGSDR